MSGPSLTFYGGVREIGGNRVLLEEGKTRLFLDFGTSFARRADFFEEYLNPRPGTGLLDPLEMGLLPPLEGVYRDDLAPPRMWERFRTRPHYRRTEIEAVLLSHAHLDHCGYVSFLRTDIPIYSTAMTAFILKAMQDSGGTDFEKEVCYSNPRTSKEGYLGTDSKQPYQQRPFYFLDGSPESEAAASFWRSSPAFKKGLACTEPGGPCQQIGSLALRYFPVDHSVFGATAFALETSAGWVAYTGDLRLHGGQGENTWRFADEMRSLSPLALVCEGTRAGEEKCITETKVYENALKAVSAASGLVIADFGPRNIERLLAFGRIAAETKRKLVILAKDAYLLDKMALVSPEVPHLEEWADVFLYAELKGTMKAWEKQVRQRYIGRLLTPTDIAACPRDFILCFSFWDVNELIDIAPKGGLYLYSSSEVFDEEGALDMERLHKWIKHFELTPLGLPQPQKEGWRIPDAEQGFHASGHASGPELLEIIRHINPKVLIPVHTEKPEYFVENLAGSGIKVVLPEYGKALSLV